MSSAEERLEHAEIWVAMRKLLQGFAAAIDRDGFVDECLDVVIELLNADRGPEVARRLRVLSLDDLPAAPPPARTAAERPPLATIVECAALTLGVDPQALRDGHRSRAATRARRLAAAVAVLDHGYSKRATAHATGCTDMAISRGLTSAPPTPQDVERLRKAIRRHQPGAAVDRKV
jgi:hypothetical protein